MKLLLDSCVWAPSRRVLESAGHDVAAVSDWGRDPGDRVILERAHAEGRTVITLDKDFGELAVVHKVPHSGIVRLVAVAPREQASVCLEAIRENGVLLRDGAIVTADAERIRLRMP